MIMPFSFTLTAAAAAAAAQAGMSVQSARLWVLFGCVTWRCLVSASLLPQLRSDSVGSDSRCDASTGQCTQVAAPVRTALLARVGETLGCGAGVSAVVPGA